VLLACALNMRARSNSNWHPETASRWTPQYAIPLAGIILGSVLNSASLALGHVLGGTTPCCNRSAACLGTSYGAATRALLLGAIRRGTLPIINQMSAAGLITLPGIMTDQSWRGSILWRR
jgi:putative ABC transport system permease protein